MRALPTVSGDTLPNKEELFRQLFQASDEAVIVFRRPEVSVVELNRAAEKLFGLSREALSAGGGQSFLEPGMADLFVRQACTLQHGAILQFDAAVAIRGDGTRFCCSLRGKLVRAGEADLLYCSFRDCSGKAHGRRDEAQALHADRMAMLGLLFPGFGHEINNPNNFIMFNSALLAEAWEAALPILDDYYRENGDFKLGDILYSSTRDVIPRLFAGLKEGSQRIRDIVDRLRDFARVDDGPGNEPFDVNSLLAQTCALLNQEIKRSCSNFRFTPGDSLPPARGNSRRIGQAFLNIVFGALQSLPQRSSCIRISTALGGDGNHIEVIVADEGQGMPPEVMARAAGSSLTTANEEGGTGNSLAIASTILRANGGAVSFVCEPGTGTTAIILLKVHPQQEEQRKEATPA